MLAEHKAHADSLDRQIFEMQLALNEAKQELALSNEERDAWKARCLNQKQKIEQLEADAVKVTKMMALHQYVPGQRVPQHSRAVILPRFLKTKKRVALDIYFLRR
jgi:hypothetical protein